MMDKAKVLENKVDNDQRNSETQLSIKARMLKRAIDIVLSIILLGFTSPLIVFLFLIIPLTSKGPALYIQERIGEFEKPFHMYKFRTMIKDAEKKTGPILALKNDKRITKIGKLIRDSKIDELPQLYNVLIGNMSLVGPRPERPYFVKQFKDKLPDYKFRMNVKPGITGLAQINGNYYTSAKDKLQYDLMYIKNFSVLFDMKILMKTCIVICMLVWKKENNDKVKEY
jgi:exopolysaccharide biosynthesis polyprenyl glycosylphosphotransferase